MADTHSKTSRINTVSLANKVKRRGGLKWNLLVVRIINFAQKRKSA
jgi:hypothetical protein